MLKFALDLHDLDVTCLSNFADNAIRQGYSFAALNERLADMERIYWLHQECRKRQPPLETHQEPQDFMRWVGLWSAGDGAYPELYAILYRDREPVGVSGLVKTEVEGTFLCGFTGILPLHSGKGLALALKAHLLLQAAERSVRRVETTVRPDNETMLRLNERLGFRLVESL